MSLLLARWLRHLEIGAAEEVEGGSEFLRFGFVIGVSPELGYFGNYGITDVRFVVLLYKIQQAAYVHLGGRPVLVLLAITVTPKAKEALFTCRYSG